MESAIEIDTKKRRRKRNASAGKGEGVIIFHPRDVETDREFAARWDEVWRLLYEGVAEVRMRKAA